MHVLNFAAAIERLVPMPFYQSDLFVATDLTRIKSVSYLTQYLSFQHTKIEEY
jgi:hypothetical protein